LSKDDDRNEGEDVVLGFDPKVYCESGEDSNYCRPRIAKEGREVWVEYATYEGIVGF
jgi:hypothetical protein